MASSLRSSQGRCRAWRPSFFLVVRIRQMIPPRLVAKTTRPFSFWVDPRPRPAPPPNHPAMVPLGRLGGGAGWCELVEKCARARARAHQDDDRPRCRRRGSRLPPVSSAAGRQSRWKTRKKLGRHAWRRHCKERSDEAIPRPLPDRHGRWRALAMMLKARGGPPPRFHAPGSAPSVATDTERRKVWLLPWIWAPGLGGVAGALRERGDLWVRHIAAIRVWVAAARPYGRVMP